MEFDGLTRVVVDTSACIYFLDAPKSDRRRHLASRLFQRVEEGALTALVSPVTVTELLVRPIRLGDVRAEAMVRLFVGRLCKVVDAGETTASHAAALRAQHNLRTPDAFIVAAAREHAVDALIGNDAAWKRINAIHYLHIDDIA